MSEVNRETLERWQRIGRVNPGYRALLAVRIDGESGEEAFAVRLAELLGPGVVALDIGCGGGDFTREMGARGARVIGLDPIPAMLTVAKETRGRSAQATFVLGAAERLPLRNDSIDVAYSRRGPGSSLRCLPETVRVLRTGGVFLQITIGERDMAEVKPYFGRGQMWGTTERRVEQLGNRLRTHGLRPVRVREFLCTHTLLGGRAELLQMLEGSPAIPDVNGDRDAAALAAAAVGLRVPGGLAWTMHRVVIEAVGSVQ